MDKIACAIILAGCVVGFCVMAIGTLKDYRAKIIAETEERMRRDWLRLKQERASWRRYRAWLQTEEGQYYAAMDISARAHRERKETT